MDCQQPLSEPSSPAPQATLAQPPITPQPTITIAQQAQQQPPIVVSQPQISNTLSISTTGVVTSTSPSVVTIPVSVVPPVEDIYTYVCVKGSLHDQNASIFGLNHEEMAALAKRFSKGTTETVNGIMVRGSPIDVINTLSKLGYKVVCSTGEVEIVWTMQREA